MLSHSTIEPLQLTRMALYKIAKSESLKTREHLARLSDTALALAQAALRSLIILEKGPDCVDIQKININDILKEQSGIFKAYAETVGIEFKLDFSGHIYFSTDPKILALILNNLIGNAIRYLQRFESNKKIIIVKAVEKDGLLIEISDNGPGLPRAVISYLNQPFTSEAPYPGGGFGVGFSRAMANMLGGDLALPKTGRFDIGTTLYLNIS
jgi:signal transduction histidine kinase